MSEHENDGFDWEPAPKTTCAKAICCSTCPSRSCRSTRASCSARATRSRPRRTTNTRNAPSDEIVVEARFGVLGMIVTPTCHIAEGENDEDVVAVVPVEPLNLVIADLAQARNVLDGKNVPLHVFPLPRTDLGGSVLGFNGVALLDRPASMLKDNLRDYRRLGLYVESRIRLRKALARFWARGNADDGIERSMRPQIESRPLEDLE